MWSQLTWVFLSGHFKWFYVHSFHHKNLVYFSNMFLRFNSKWSTLKGCVFVAPIFQTNELGKKKFLNFWTFSNQTGTIKKRISLCLCKTFFPLINRGICKINKEFDILLDRKIKILEPMNLSSQNAGFQIQTVNFW